MFYRNKQAPEQMFTCISACNR